MHDVDGAALLETVDRVSRSASRDESRPVLTGILVRFEPGKLVMAATDSYRLSVKETPSPATRRSSRRSSRPARSTSSAGSRPAETTSSSASTRTTSCSAPAASG